MYLDIFNWQGEGNDINHNACYELYCVPPNKKIVTLCISGRLSAQSAIGKTHIFHIDIYFNWTLNSVSIQGNSTAHRALQAILILLLWWVRKYLLLFLSKVSAKNWNNPQVRNSTLNVGSKPCPQVLEKGLKWLTVTSNLP